jgi:hypothetical protein
MVDATASLRRQLYTLIITVVGFVLLAKIVGAENLPEPSRHRPPNPDSYGADRPAEHIPPRDWPTVRPDATPMFGSNDRSRWATIRALVDNGTYVIGRRVNFTVKSPPFEDTGILFENSYRSLDVVMNRQTGEYYSSKPTLMPTVLAGEYWLLKQLFGWSIKKDRWLVVSVILVSVNLLPMLVFLVLVACLAEQYCTSDWARIFVVLFAGLGTFLTNFSMTLNNHNPAACCVMFAIYPLLSKHGRPALASPWKLAVSGFFLGLLPTLELPGLALTAAIFGTLTYLKPIRVGICFGLAMLLPVSAAFATEYVARGRVAPTYSEFNKSEETSEYKYPGSHWAKIGTPAAKGIDFLDEPKTTYAFHLTFGHHGWFSLTPVWLIALAGLCVMSRSAFPELLALLRRSTELRIETLSLITLIVSSVLFGFYILRTNNYGGNTSGPRWLFWLIPLWILGLFPALDWLSSRRWGRATSALCLGLSAFSVFYPAWNPWRNPWLLQLLEVNGWLVY